MPVIGYPYTFRISLGGNFRGADGQPISHALKGRITYINHDHRYFIVEAVTENGTRIRECFKF